MTAMSSASVLSAKQLFEIKSTNTDAKDTTSRSKSFSGMLNKATESKHDNSSKSNLTTKAGEEGNNTDELNAVSDNNKKVSEKKESSKKENTDIEKYADAAGKMVIQIARILNVTPEQIIDSMEQTGITPDELVTPEGITGIMVNLNNLNDNVEIILDNGLHNQFKEILQTLTDNSMLVKNIEDFQKNNDLIQNGLQENEISRPDISDDVSDIYTMIKENIIEMSENSSFVNNENNQTDNSFINGKIFENETQLSEIPEEKNENISNTVNLVNDEKTDEMVDISSDNSDFLKNSNDEKNSAEGETTEINAQQNGYTNVVNTLTNAINERFDSVTATSIVRQITEQIKATSGNGISSIEITLNPESLGKVNIQVVSKDGAVTAQISTENEITKQAIESQIATLKETLANQNIKVDAVEVTVSNHSFENNGESGEKEQKEQGKSTTGKKILLRDFFEEPEEEPEENIIMKAEGNTVSYSA